MLGTSICPNCDATFNIDEEQLDAAQGMVRCGRCMEIFDFRISYVANQPDPQLELPISNEHTVEDVSDEPFLLPEDDERITAALASARHREIFGESNVAELNDDDIQPSSLVEEIKHVLTEEAQDIATLAPVEFDDVETLQPVGESELNSSQPAQSPVIRPVGQGNPQEVEYEFAKKSNRRWPWAIASGLCLLVLAMQVVYLFRVEVAANFPASKPTLESACQILNCFIALPHQANLMSIESSSLSDAPKDFIVLEALLRNHAGYAQAFPNLELTLTDTQDNPQARRNFKPADYLSRFENETTGLLANHEINIKLHLDTMDIKPSGYRLVLYYPE